jgi:hypothetical protein
LLRSSAAIVYGSLLQSCAMRCTLSPRASAARRSRSAAPTRLADVKSAGVIGLVRDCVVGAARRRVDVLVKRNGT